jgi:hypothetical protein
MAKSYVALLKEKVKVIEANKKDKLLVQEIMMRSKCGKTQVFKQKDKIMNKWLHGNGRMKKKA